MSNEDTSAEEAGLLSPELSENAWLSAVASGQATIARGVKSDAVLALQKALVALDANVRADSDFGPKTEAAIMAEQYRANLPKTGILDSETLRAIDRRLAEKRKKALLGAMEVAVGPASGPSPSPAREVAANAKTPSRTDSEFFVDATDLPSVNPGPVDDPESPAPEGSVRSKAPPLPADRRALYEAIVEALGDEQSGINALARLLESGRLHQGALLSSLAAMAKTPRNPKLLLEVGIEPSLLLAQTIRHLDNPLRCQQGYGRGTCGAGVMQYVILRSDPAELVRLLDGITREAGAVKLRSGRMLAMPHSAMARDNSGRVDIDRLFQSTLMNHATAMSWVFDYDNPNDDDTFWAVVRGNSQVSVWGFASLLEDIMGQRLATATQITRSKQELVELCIAHTLKGEKVPVILRFNELHWLSVEWVERGRDGHAIALVLRNPWGRDDGSGPPPRTAMPEGGGRIRMTIADFEENVFGLVVRG